MLTLSQRQALQQRLSPQQVQYLKMLQLPVIALEQRIKQELEANPMLEELSEITQEVERDQEEIPESSADDALNDDKDSEDREIDWDELMPDDYEGYKAPTFTGQENEDQEELPQPSEQSLAERLLDQLRLQSDSHDDMTLAEEIIGNIDDDGYLRRSLAEIVEDLNKFVAATRPAQLIVVPEDNYQDEDDDEPAPSVGDHDGLTATAEVKAPSLFSLTLEEMSRLSIDELARMLEQGTAAPVAVETNDDQPAQPALIEPTIAEIFSLEEAERVLRRIQRLEPPGIGSRNLQECLSIQLELAIEQDPTPERELALRVIRKTYNEFTMKHFEKICHRLGCDTEELRAAIEVIRTLNPKPGEGASSIINANYVTPDFVVERDGDAFVIIPNDRGVPALRISPAYQQMLRRKANAKQSGVDKQTRKFLREKFESAKWFIASIRQRRQTMMKVMQAIVDLQSEFFALGPDHIKPMIYKDVAEHIGMDISTVCRVVNGKYVQTDYGTYELRYFFSEKLETVSGEEVSTKIVKARIQELIENEDKSNPLSDDALSQAMHEAGFNVARRTVAKYREQMNIPVARLRRSL